MDQVKVAYEFYRIKSFVMKAILVINDQSNAARHAFLLATMIAEKRQSKIVLANTYQKRGIFAVAESAGHFITKSEDLAGEVKTKDIQELDISGMNESEVAQMTGLLRVDMIVKGMAERSTVSAGRLNVHYILNKVVCPLLVVPENWPLKQLERIVYIEDLRYCRRSAVNCLAGIAEWFGASLSVAHLSADGIPDMEEQYANSVFKKEVYDRLAYPNVFFNNIKEKDVRKALDVLVNGLHNDLLALVNHRFHFREILGRYLTEVLPAYVTVPLLIFPY